MTTYFANKLNKVWEFLLLQCCNNYLLLLNLSINFTMYLIASFMFYVADMGTATGFLMFFFLRLLVLLCFFCLALFLVGIFILVRDIDKSLIFKIIIFLIICVLSIVTLSQTAEAVQKGLLAADSAPTNVPLLQIVDAALAQDPTRYNRLSQLYNISNTFGKNASFLNTNLASNSHDLLQQVGSFGISQAENKNNSNLHVVTGVVTGDELVYLKRSILNETDVARFLAANKKPLVYFDSATGNWLLGTTKRNLEPLPMHAQYILENYSSDVRFFPKSGNLQAVRIGDMLQFSPDLKVYNAVECKTVHNTLLNEAMVSQFFKNNFANSLLVDKQILDITTGLLYRQNAGASEFKVYNFHELFKNRDDYNNCNYQFWRGRQIAMITGNKLVLVNSTLSWVLGNVWKYVIH